MASIQGMITRETTLKTSHIFSHFQARTNFDGSMQLPDINPATITRETPATTGCPISDSRPRPETNSNHMTHLVLAEFCNSRPQPTPEKRSDCAGAECAPGTRAHSPTCGTTGSENFLARRLTVRNSLTPANLVQSACT